MFDNLIKLSKSGFKALVFRTNQLLPLIHDNSILKKELKSGDFSQYVKAFNKVWHEDILSKRKQNWISRNLLNILTHFISLSSLYNPWKHKKASGFLTFSGGIK